MPNIIVEHPMLTEEERMAREKEVKRAIVNLLKERKEYEEGNK